MSFELCSRPRNAAVTRAAILSAANARFAAESYDQVGLRDIARDVGVDPALISRYFGSKEDLFTEVLDDCGDGGDMMEGERSEFGDRVARDLVYGARKEGKLQWLLLMLRSVASPKAAEVVQRTSHTRFFEPFIAWVGGEDAAIKARLAAGMIMGLAVSRDLTGGFGLSEAESARLHIRLAGVLQDLIDRPLDGV